MNNILLGNSNMQVSQLALGLMRSSLYEANEMQTLLEKATELGINFVDHADIYAWKNCAEEVYGQVMLQAPHLKDKFLVQTKCGICRGYYDFSYEHIIESVNTSLKRMNIDHIDVLLLHRPDALMEPEEVARAFDDLEAAGKVRHFGVSNMNPGQIENLKRCVRQELVANQLQLSITHAPMIDAGFYVNTTDDRAIVRESGILEYSQIKGMTIQGWSILQASWEQGTFLDNSEFSELNQVLERLSDKYGITKSAIAVAWILRHPAKIQPITGTVNPAHLEELTKAFDITLTRQEWYELYQADGKKIP